MKKVVIIGAGPSGLTLAYDLLKNSSDYEVIILERSNKIGGISRTENYKHNLIDIGGHRFFTKDNDVMNLWKELMPIQNKPTWDYKKLGIDMNLSKGKVNPEKDDNVLLKRRRISRILYNNKFYNYPVSMSFNTLKNFGFIKSIACGFSYLKSCLLKKEESNLENFYINRFGKELYSTFFEKYTEKVWGRHPREIDASWGSQRVKGISIKEIIKNMFKKSNETSLIEEFYYPKFGPGSMYEEMAKKIKKMGGKIILNSEVNEIVIKNNKVKSIKYNNEEINVDILVSSMAIKDLINSIKTSPKNVVSIANKLPYRDFITVGVLVDKLKIQNKTKLKTINNIVPDTWIYVQESSVKLGRIQVFNNWSPYLLKDNNKVWLGLEYFCNDTDDFWNMLDKDIKKFAIDELCKLNIVNKEDISDSCVIRMKKAYPAYFDSYDKIDIVKKYLFSIDNLYCVGRNGQHRYNNMDHSMKTGLIASYQIRNKQHNNNELWNVNTEDEYHEESK